MQYIYRERERSICMIFQGRQQGRQEHCAGIQKDISAIIFCRIGSFHQPDMCFSNMQVCHVDILMRAPPTVLGLEIAPCIARHRTLFHFLTAQVVSMSTSSIHLGGRMRGLQDSIHRILVVTIIHHLVGVLSACGNCTPFLEVHLPDLELLHELVERFST